jgi:hypothetical protein
MTGEQPASISLVLEERAPKSGLPDFSDLKVEIGNSRFDFDARVSKDGHRRDGARAAL